MSDKNLNVISKKDAYMLIAKLIAKRSKDPNTQVGAVIVSDKDRILSLGYNGFPNGCSDDEFPWAREADSEYDTKYPYVIHAELNAILNFFGDNHNLVGSSLYVTLFPCRECAKAIIQSGIACIYYEDNKYKDTLDHKESCRMLEAAGVRCIQYLPSADSFKTLFGS